MLGSSCGGRNSSCTCALCLVLERVVNTCYRKGRTPAFIQSAVEKLRALQGELFDLAELEERALLSPGIAGSAPHPGPGEGSVGGGALAPQGVADPEKPRFEERGERPESHRRKASPSNRSGHHQAERRSRRRRRQEADCERSPSYSRKGRPVEEPRGEESPRRHRGRRRGVRAEDRPGEERGEAFASARRSKEEPASEELEKEAVEEVDEKTGRSLCATAKFKPSPGGGERGGEGREEGRSRSSALRRRRPVSPVGGPSRGSGWKGPILAGSQGRGRSPPRWGKNRGKKKFQRNEDVRRLGWHNFHATKGRHQS